MKKIGLACDHAGFDYKENKKYLETKGYQTTDFGCYSDKSVDYPDFAHELTKAISSNDCDFGIQFVEAETELICQPTNTKQFVRLFVGKLI